MAISVSSAGRISSAFVLGDVAPDLGRAGREPRRVDEPASGELEPGVTDGVADDLHQRARGQLRQVTQEREQAIVRGRVEDSRLGAQRPHECDELLERIRRRPRRSA